MNNSSDWGLTERGFRRPVYGELLDAYEYKARELFGAKANLTIRSPLGMFLRIFAWFTDILFQVIESVYNSRFVDTAAGVSLYNLGRAIGLHLLSAQKAAGYIEVTGEPGAAVPEGFLAATAAGLQYVVLSRAVIGESGTVTVPVRAFYPGTEYNAEPNAITQIVNPDDGRIHRITNPSRVDGGKYRETDEEFRDRYMLSVDFAGGVNAEAIAAEIRQSVGGVYSVSPFENDTDFTDELGLPPHSFEQVVYGGLDFDIAKAIFRRKAAGIQTYGNVTVPVVSVSGQIIDISFSRPEPVDVWVNIYNIAAAQNYFDLPDLHERIRKAAVKHIGGSISGGLKNGADVIYKELSAVIMSVEGLQDFDFRISSDGVNYGYSNIQIDAHEKAVTDETKVVILE